MEKYNDWELSTPHGALGTQALKELFDMEGMLSTPHGALGTEKRSTIQKDILLLSTPHGALGTFREFLEGLGFRVFQLHTVH